MDFYAHPENLRPVRFEHEPIDGRAPLSRRRVLASTAIVAAGGVPGCLGHSVPTLTAWTPEPGDWPLVRYGPANGGYNPNATPPHEDVELRWRATVDGSLNGVLAADGVVVGYGDDGMWAREAADGDARWSVDGEARTAGIYDGVAYACGREMDEEESPGRLRGFDLATGEEVFSTTIGGTNPWLDALVLTAELALVGDRREDVLRAVDLTDGEVVWQPETGLTVGLDDEWVIVGGRRSLYAYDTAVDSWFDDEPSRVWTSDAGTDLGVPPPAIDRGSVFTGDRLIGGEQRATIHGYRRRDGHKRWTAEPDGKWTSTPAVPDDIGYAVHTRRGREEALVVAIDLTDGGREWAVEVEGWLHRAIATEDIVIAYGGDDRTESGLILAVDPDGTERWRYETDAPTGWQSGAIAVEDVVYAATEDGELLALGS